MSQSVQRLKAYRVLHDIKQLELANLLNISLSTYSQKETGKAEFTLEEARKISERLQTTVDNIFFNNKSNL